MTGGGVTGRAAVVAAALLVALTGCGAQDGLGAAGTPLPTAPSTSASAVPGVSGSAAPSLVASAGLEPCPVSDAGAAPVADGLPDLTLPCLGPGSSVRLAGLRGKPAVVNVWASWCEPCRTELPVLAAASAAAGGRVRFLGIDQSDTPDAAVAMLTAAGVHYPSVADPDGQGRAGLRAVALPVTLFVRADGTVAHRLDGPVPDAAALRALVAEHLGVTT